jgi:hypothetical protein
MTPSPSQFETEEKIRKGLGPVRWLRWMAMFGLLFPVGLTVLIVIAHKLSGGGMSFMVSEAPWTHRFWDTLYYMFVAGVFFSLLNLARVCPRCRNGFFQRRGFRKTGSGSKLNRTGWRFNVNTFSRSCLNCGLRLDGSNAGESFEK